LPEEVREAAHRYGSAASRAPLPRKLKASTTVITGRSDVRFQDPIPSTAKYFHTAL
jgi:hypothetical protein